MGALTEPVYEEPTRRSSLRKYERVLIPLLQKRNGNWAVIGEYSSVSSAYQAALNLRKGRYRIAGEPDDWEFLADGNKVFARTV